DVFICYKETDESGRRTQDSVIANDLYHQLTQEGFKVFFSRITLEDKIGTAYEPYIFAALNSAKVMVVLGTKPEYFNAVWVKNEWSRFLALVKESNGKKMLVPAYRDMDPYNLPEEFSHLQAQDMSKLGFMQDLIRGIKKITGADEVKQPEKVVVERGNTNIDALIERAFMSLEFNEWDKADDFCEQVLNQDPKNPQAYLGKLLAELKLASKNELINCAEPFDDSKNYIQAVRFSDSLEKELKSFNEQIRNRNEEARKEGIYSNAKSLMDKAASEFDYNKVSQTFSQIPGYKDADSLVNICKERIVEIQKKEEEKIREIEEKEELQRAAAKKKKILISAICLMLALATVISVVMVTVIIPQNKIKKATESFNQGNYSDIYAGYKFNFGTYNGEDITWRVLAKEENKILVISDKALFHKEYNEVYTDTTWEKCTLRKYLNNDFLNNCFSEENQKKILKTKVINDNNPEYGTSGGADTMDKVFLLSIDEANKYFASDNDRKARDILGQKSFWWLRSPGYSSNFAACVCGDGSVDNFGFNVIRGGLAVRPALWINLES
ncbi:MAG: toll/interleukin-1 receptor domain-containing protein, partial [Clostridiales bacterium]|nr:toll/interleukin-1 receptor domain-containing protein [Clostridiales bacterium]